MNSDGLQAIVFDFDGVIVDTERLHLLAYQDILAPKGITMSAADYFERYLGYDDVGVFKALGKDQDLPMDDGRVTALIAEKGRRYEELSAAGEMLFPGAADFIRAAAAAVPIAIASGALTHEIEEILERTGLRPLFPVIVGADQTERSKPNPDPYVTAFARLRALTGPRPRSPGGRWRSKTRSGASCRRGAPTCAASRSPTPTRRPSCAPTRSWWCRACTRSRLTRWTRCVPTDH